MRTAVPSLVLALVLLNVFQTGLSAQEDRSSTEISGTPDIRITLEDYDHEVDTRHGVETSVLVNGTVECIIPEGRAADETCTIQLYIVSDPWASSDPPEMFFTRDVRTIDLQFRVTPPFSGWAFETQIIEITGTWEYSRGEEGGPVGSAFINITPKRFLDVDLCPVASGFSGKPGEWVDFSVYVINNEDRDVNVTLTTMVNSRDVEVKPVSIRLLVPRGSSINQSFQARNTKGVLEKNIITVNGTCEEGEPYFTMSVELYLETVFDTGPYLKVLMAICSAVSISVTILAVVIISIRIRKRARDRNGTFS
ncbi:MAG: hypothetical protein JXA22_01245 [Candidatus Thermoplasmatota archaeon]|nr:hypothetical protein [Candidatus Thermoplasmatota archaeon]